MTDKVQTSFSPDDVRAVAEAVTEHFVQPQYHGDWGPHESTWECIACEASHPDDADKVKHSLDCPYLIARDLLT